VACAQAECSLGDIIVSESSNLNRISRSLYMDMHIMTLAHPVVLLTRVSMNVSISWAASCEPKAAAV
jgi:hypothetical protein